MSDSSRKIEATHGREVDLAELRRVMGLIGDKDHTTNNRAQCDFGRQFGPLALAREVLALAASNDRMIEALWDIATTEPDFLRDAAGDVVVLWAEYGDGVRSTAHSALPTATAFDALGQTERRDPQAAQTSRDGLLEALKGLVQDYDALSEGRKSTYKSPNGICAYDNAVAAIAKAEGR